MPQKIDTIATHPAFLPSLSAYGARLAAVYEENQRLGANLGFQRRWLMSQVALALYWNADGGNALTTSNLIAALRPFRVASTNTIRDFVEEMATYGFINPDPGRSSVRPRYWQPSNVVVGVLRLWFQANLAILDALDSGERVTIFSSNSGLLEKMQPRFAWNCLRDERWREPPARVGLLQRSISGGLVMDNIAVLVGSADRENGRFIIPAINTREMAGRILISRTHLQRVMKKTIDAGALGWQGRPFESNMWVDGSFIDEYCRWQAVKSYYMDEAFNQFVV